MQKNVNIQNKKARHEYEILDTFIAGIKLTGTEIKSIRAGKVRISEAYCSKGARKLLLNKHELRKLHKEVKNTGLTIIPLRLFITEKGWAKLKIALCKGKKLYDKRQVIKDREHKRSLDRLKKNYR